MGWRERYLNAKEKLLDDESICEANRAVFTEFFEFEEYKLKRQNQLRDLDDACYKTLYGYVLRFRNVNAWFNNKPWRDLTREDIKRVYDDLEDGRIRNYRGLPFADRSSYYNKVFKSKPFRIVQKSELAKDVIEFSTDQPCEVRFVTEETFRTMVSVVSKPRHLFLFWLAWDIGENIGALLQLTKRDFVRQQNRHTREIEYLVNLPRSKIKRARKARSEPTLYPETVRYADIVVADLEDDDCIFPFGHRQALKIMHSVVKKTAATCLPNNAAVRWKDLRSGMACHLLRNGWSLDEVRARLGHKPNSDAIARYVSYLAIDRSKPKQKLFDSSVERLQQEVEEARRRERLIGDRLSRQEEQNATTKVSLVQVEAELGDLRRILDMMQHKVRAAK